MEILVKNFRQMVLVFFWYEKQERDWVVPFTKYWLIFRFLSTWSLPLVIQTTGTENFGRFGKNRKKVIPQKVLLIFHKISTRMNSSIRILPGIPRFSIPMVSAQTLLFISIVLTVTNINFLLTISTHYQGKWLRELIRWSPNRKCFDLLIKLSQLIFKEMYEYQSGEFGCGYWGLKVKYDNTCNDYTMYRNSGCTIITKFSYRT